MNKAVIIFIILVLLVVSGLIIYNSFQTKSTQEVVQDTTDQLNLQLDQGGLENQPHDLSIDFLRKGEYPGSDLEVEQTLNPGSNYQRYIVSYLSEGLKIYALLTVPDGDPPDGGWPVVVFNHGYIPPKEYKTTERYVGYVDGFARNGYVVLKPDYRGHGQSEGEPTGAYGSNSYAIDVLNSVASVKKLRDPLASSGRFVVDTNRIGMWGHSLGGFLTLRSMVVSRDIKAGVIWAGVVAAYPDLLNNWRRRSFSPPPGIPSGARRWRDTLLEQFGTPEQNPNFWNSISANSFLKDISGPIQLHHGTADTSVPIEFSQKLETQMKLAGKEVELFIYQGDDHNLTNNIGLAIQRSVEFFDQHLKN